MNINFVAFNKYLYPDQLDGIFFTIFIITIAAAEAAVAIAIIINLYRSHHSIDVEDADELKCELNMSTGVISEMLMQTYGQENYSL